MLSCFVEMAGNDCSNQGLLVIISNINSSVFEHLQHNCNVIICIIYLFGNNLYPCICIHQIDWNVITFKIKRICYQNFDDMIPVLKIKAIKCHELGTNVIVITFVMWLTQSPVITILAQCFQSRSFQGRPTLSNYGFSQNIGTKHFSITSKNYIFLPKVYISGL